MLAGEYRDLGRHIYSSAAFVQNFRLLADVGYFTEDALRQPLLHLWSLAIEEQFYIIFPIICTLIWKFSKSKSLIGAAILLITVGSFTACMLVQDRNFNFYFPLTRFWELGAGICLAFVESYGIFKARNLALGLRHALSVLGLVAVLAPMFLWSTDMVHPGWITLFPVLGALSLIAANPDALLNKTLLSWRPVTFVGLISYSLYLWHWPLLAYLFICYPAHSAAMPLLALVASFVIASCVYYYVENPIRRSVTIKGFSTVKFLLVGLVIVVGIGEALRISKGWTSRPINKTFASVNAVRAVNEWTPHDRAPKLTYSDTEIRVTSPVQEIPKIVFVGDSHTAHYFTRAQVITQKTGKPAAFIASWKTDIFNPDQKGSPAKAFLAAIEDERVKTIIIGRKWGRHVKNGEPIGKTGDALKLIRQKVSERKDLRLYVLLDPPYVEGENGQQGITDPLLHLKRTNFRRSDYVIDIPDHPVWKIGNEAVVKFFKNTPSVTFIDPTPYICPNGKCDLLKWYKDDDHLQPLRVEKEAVWIDTIFE